MTTLCATSQVIFANRDWPKAWQGDYQGQRNAAFCRSNSCDGAVQLNQAEACAWRAIILAAHIDESNDTDSTNLNIDCGKLDEAGAALATTKAESMFRRIYGKDMPSR